MFTDDIKLTIDQIQIELYGEDGGQEGDVFSGKRD